MSYQRLNLHFFIFLYKNYKRNFNWKQTNDQNRTRFPSIRLTIRAGVELPAPSMAFDANWNFVLN